MAKDTMDLQVQETEKQEIVDSDAERTRDCVCFVPRVDIYETNDAIFVTADMPGVDETSVDIMLENDVLTINGYIKPVEPEGYQLAHAEYRVGDYERRFTLSNKIDQERIEATMKNGVLSLHLPKALPTTKTIAVKAG